MCSTRVVLALAAIAAAVVSAEEELNERIIEFTSDTIFTAGDAARYIRSNAPVRWDEEAEAAVLEHVRALQLPSGPWERCQDLDLAYQPRHVAGFGSQVHAKISGLLLGMALNRTLIGMSPGVSENALVLRSKCQHDKAKSARNDGEKPMRISLDRQVPPALETTFVEGPGGNQTHMLDLPTYQLTSLFGGWPLVPEETWSRASERGSFQIMDMAGAWHPISAADLPYSQRIKFFSSVLSAFLIAPEAPVVEIINDIFERVTATLKDDPAIAQGIPKWETDMDLFEWASRRRSAIAEQATRPRIIGMQLRTTDKTREDPYYIATGTYRSVESISEALKITSDKCLSCFADKAVFKEDVRVLLMSDSNQTLNAVSHALEDRGFKVAIVSGMGPERFQSAEDPKTNSKQYRGSHIQGVVAELLALSALSDELIMTTSSNIGRLLLELVSARKRITQIGTQGVNGRSMDCPWMAAGCQHILCLRKFSGALKRSTEEAVMKGLGMENGLSRLWPLYGENTLKRSHHFCTVNELYSDLEGSVDCHSRYCRLFDA